MGNAYSSGHGVPQNDTRAIYWWRKAARQGYEPAELSLGNSFAVGKGVPKNLRIALQWWAKVVAQGGSDGKIAKYNITVYHKRQKAKQVEAQEAKRKAAEDAKWAKINGQICRIEFTVYNNSKYTIDVGGLFPHGGVYACIRSQCGQNFLAAISTSSGIGRYGPLPPGYHETFKSNPYFEFGYDTDLRHYYIQIRLKIQNSLKITVYRFNSSWYSTCERPNFYFNPTFN